MLKNDFFQQEGLAAQQSVLEVDQPLGVERLPVIAGLEMQVRPRAAPRRAAQTDDLPVISSTAKPLPCLAAQLESAVTAITLLKMHSSR